MRRTDRRTTEGSRGGLAHTGFRAPHAALAGLLSLSVLGIGGVHFPVLAVLALLALTTAFLASRSSPTSIPAPAWLALGLAAYTLFQAVPLPRSVLGTIAPGNAAVWAGVVAPYGEGAPAWSPVSLDPGASKVEALKWVTYALTFYAAFNLSRRTSAPTCLTIVFASALVAAVATLGHGLAGAEHVFGLYAPAFRPAPWHVGPLLNPNNLSGYLNLGIICGLGLMLGKRPLIPRWLLGVGIAMATGVSIASASRGGVAALLFGVSVLAFMRRHHRSGQRLLLVATLTVAAGVLLAVLASSPDQAGELWERDAEKLNLLRYVLPMVREHAWFGVGRGAFESVFPAFRNAPGNLVYAHAENFVAEWAAGWGIPVAGCTLAAGAWLFRPTFSRRVEGGATAAGWCAALAVTVQNFVDLGFEVPALGLAMATVMGFVYAARSRHDRNDQPTRPLMGLARVVVTAVVLLLVLVGWTPGGRSVAAERSAVHRDLELARGDEPRLRELSANLRNVMLRHPAEPYFPLVGALAAVASKDGNPMPWIRRTLERELSSSRAHLVLADVLVQKRAINQALMELKLCVQDDPALIDTAARRAVRWAPGCEDLLRVVPDGVAGAPVLAGLAAAVSDDPCAERLARASLERSPRLPAAHALLGGLLTRAMANMGDRCAGARQKGCETEIEAHAHAIETARPSWFEPTRLRVEALLAVSRHSEAAQLLDAKCSEVDERQDCLLYRMRVAAASESRSAMTTASSDYLLSACGDAVKCAAAAILVGDEFARLGDWGTAMKHYQRATQEDANEVSWLKFAEASNRTGAHATAAEALTKVLRLRGGNDAALQERIARERDLALPTAR